MAALPVWDEPIITNFQSCTDITAITALHNFTPPRLQPRNPARYTDAIKVDSMAAASGNSELFLTPVATLAKCEVPSGTCVLVSLRAASTEYDNCLSNHALYYLINSRKLSAISLNLCLSDKNSSEYP